MEKEIKITCPDGRLLYASKFSAISPSKNKFIIINSALGIGRPFYKAFATHLASEGYDVLTWDPRGTGQSADKNPKTDQARMRDWGMIDLEAVLQLVTTEKWASWEQITIIGHSAGGHLTGLCPSIPKISQIIMVASGTCNWKLYPPKELPKILFSWWVLVPVLVNAYGYAPAKFGVGHDLPRGVVMDWRNWSLKEDYLFSDKTLGKTHYADYAGEIFSLRFSDDQGFTPEKTAIDLLNHFPKARISRKVINPKEAGLKSVGHFGFFKKSNQKLWSEVTQKIL